MALGPNMLLQLTSEDVAAVDKLEKFIDTATEMKNFDGGEVKIPIPSELYQECLSRRTSVRYGALRGRYAKAGWKEISLNGSGDKRVFVLNQNECWD